MSEFMSVAEIAKKWSVSRMTVYRMIHSGELPSIRIGRSIRVKREHVDQYINQGE